MDTELPTLRNIRRLVLLVMIGGTVAMGIDLILVGHYEDTNQLIPLAVAGAGLVAVGWTTVRPGIIALRLTQFVMLCFIGAGIIGIALHFQANAEFQREIDPSISTRDLFWKVVEATAPPAFAPGLMVQLGLLGLVYTYRHPVLRAPRAGRNQTGGGSLDAPGRFEMKIGIVLATAGMLLMGPTAYGQVGKSQGLSDANTASDVDLVKAPHMTPDIVQALIAARPFGSIVDLNKLLLAQKLSQEQATAFYEKVFVHVNLNTATPEEILLIPRAGKRMAHEFEEYRPWKTWAQFDKEIGKYVGAQETARLAQYGFIPINLNTASDADLLTIPGVAQRMLHEFKEYRPWKTGAQFDKEIGKYVDQKEVQRLKRYVVIP